MYDKNRAGRIIHYNGTSYLVFGTATVPTKFSIRDTYHIGINLEKGRVEDVQVDIEPVLDVHLHELSDQEQDTLIKFLPMRNAISQRLITISGKARSGKDTIASRISETLDCALITPLSRPIKLIDQIINGFSDKKNREGLIMIGQGLREVDPNIWIKTWLRNALNDLETNSECWFIVPDVRQPNEFSFFKSLGATTIKVTANEKKRLQKIAEKDGEEAVQNQKLLNDETETHAEKFETDFHIHNEYDEKFFEDIDKILKEIGH